ncbi:stress response rds1p [Fusarium subglutinans]|uniref:Stress response rds1p n=1 Tax=Gibberella subglutinans TaxID=42677 RepID=A0A8H5P6M3_GIBSU|nr:stress response rds1p [Fusarium subglutinans]KAF5591024.1 stress response rds1p [Fusarium subglutinans]
MSLAKALHAVVLLSNVADGAAMKIPRSSPVAQKLTNPHHGPVPGESPLYSTYRGKSPPFPANVTDPILPTRKGKPGVDDMIWQNLLSAEWAIFSFYQQGEIRDNEAGHLRIFQDQISDTSLKPGSCKYQYPFNDPESFLVLSTFIEIASMTFLTGLVQMAKLPTSQGAMTAIAAVETRHEVWSLMDIWNVNPFSGPSDTVFPYANQILDLTNGFVIKGSCPKENPIYPNPRQGLPSLNISPVHKTVTPGSTITFKFTDNDKLPKFEKYHQYYTTFFHGPWIIAIPIDMRDWPQKNIIDVKIPEAFESRGIIIAVVTDTVGAPTKDTVLAGPAILLQQPAELGAKVADIV